MPRVPDDLALIRQYYELFNDRRLQDAAALVAADCTFVHVPTRARATGPAGYLLLASGWLKNTPDAQTTVVSITPLDEGRYCVILRGTGHRDPRVGVVRPPAGVEPPPFPFTAVQDVWIRDGQLASATLTYDSRALAYAQRR